MLKNSLPYKNLTGRPGRTLMLIFISLLLSFSVLGGTLVIYGLQSGIASLDARLGADIIVVPYEATTKEDYSEMILQGSIVSCYMDRSKLDKIASLDGIGEISEQFYLATTKASCCSSKLQIIGYNPETDFTISPWIKTSYGKSDIGYMEILVGNDINAFAGDTLTFYGQQLTVASRLDKTGTYLDTAVYAGEDTIKTLMQAALDGGFLVDYAGKSPDSMVSCILINAAEGTPIEDVVNDINLHVKGVKAVQTQGYVTQITTGLTNVSFLIKVLMIAIWILAIVMLFMAFAMITRERKKEFAVLRAIGASRKKLSRIILKETLIINVIGSVLGSIIAVITVLIAGNYIQTELGMPFLLPGAVKLILIVAGAFALSVFAGSLAALAATRRSVSVDTAFILRGED